MGASPKPAAAPTLPDLARQSLRDAGGDTAIATLALTNRLLADKGMLRHLVAALVQEAVASQVELSHRHNRAAIIRAATSATSRRDRVVALADGISAALLDMPLAGGLKLRDAEREAVIAQADRYETTGTDMLRKSRFLRLIAQRVQDGQTVGEVVSEARALELWDEVSR